MATKLKRDDVYKLTSTTWPAMHQIMLNGYECTTNYVTPYKKGGYWQLIVSPKEQDLFEDEEGDGSLHFVRPAGGRRVRSAEELDELGVYWDEDYEEWEEEDGEQQFIPGFLPARCVKHELRGADVRLQNNTYTSMFQRLEQEWGVVLATMRQLEENWVD